MKHIGMIIGLVVLAIGMGMVGAQSSVNVTLFLENDNLIVYVPGTEPVSLQDFTFETVIGGVRQQFRLEGYSVFQALRFDALPAPLCFRLRLSGATPTLPQACDPTRTLDQPLASADIFWYDAASAQRRTLTVFGGGTNIFCPSGQFRCEMSYISPIASPTMVTTLIPLQSPTPIFETSFGTSLENGVTANQAWTPVIQDFDGVSMALVPTGCFMMGRDRYQYEGPVHEQCFERPFWIDVYEVTQAQFERFNGGKSEDNAFHGSQRPVEMITWFEALDFCETHRHARLPTEREWEYAARGVDSLVYPWGNDFSPQNLVYDSNSGRETAEVGSHPSGVSWVGAFDLSGNVWEWVKSLSRPYPYDATDGRETIQTDNDLFSFRGGSWNFDIGAARSDVRNAGNPYTRSEAGGFRCARDWDG